MTCLRRLVVLILAIPAEALTAPTPASAQAGAVLLPGDVVHLTVWRRPELSGEFAITADSSIAHPLLRDVKVVGLPMAEVEGRLRSFLQTLEANPQFVLQPMFRIAVGGEVRSPNLYTFPAAITVAQAVALAGGPTERGRLDQVRLRRNGREIIVDLTDLDTEAARMPIRSGDQIVLARRGSFFRDYVTPAASVTAAIGTLLTLFSR